MDPPGIARVFLLTGMNRLHPYIRPVPERLVSPGPDGIRALPPQHYRDLKGPVACTGSGSAGLTYCAISRLSPRNLWRDSLCPNNGNGISSGNLTTGVVSQAAW